MAGIVSYGLASYPPNTQFMIDHDGYRCRHGPLGGVARLPGHANIRVSETQRMILHEITCITWQYMFISCIAC